MKLGSDGIASQKASFRRTSNFQSVNHWSEYGRDFALRLRLAENLDNGFFGRSARPTRVPRSRVDANWHFIDNYSWKAGKHDVKFGYEFRRTTIALIQDNTFRGKLDSTICPRFCKVLPSSGKGVQGNSRRHTFENNHGFYVQDSYRWTSRLTMNFGIRWDYFGVAGEKNGLL